MTISARPCCRHEEYFLYRIGATRTAETAAYVERIASASGDIHLEYAATCNNICRSSKIIAEGGFLVIEPKHLGMTDRLTTFVEPPTHATTFSQAALRLQYVERREGFAMRLSAAMGSLTCHAPL